MAWYLKETIAKGYFMILVLDLGNTNIYIGVYQNGELKKTYRTFTDPMKSQDNYRDLLEDFFQKHHFESKDFSGAIISSVVPDLSTVLKGALDELLEIDSIIISKGVKTGLSIRIDNPNELGTDLVADAIGAIKKYHVPCLIADLGTANKIIVIDRNGNFIGVIIFAGIKVASKALSRSAAQLMDISYNCPKSVIGKNSIDSLNSGSIYGTIAAIEGLAIRVEKELGYPMNKILTGGNANLIKDHIDNFVFDQHLILDGLYEIYFRNGGVDHE